MTVIWTNNLGELCESHVYAEFTAAGRQWLVIYNERAREFQVKLWEEMIL